MNFLPGEIDGDTLKLPIGDVPLSESLRRRLRGRARRRTRRRDRRHATRGLRGRDAGRRREQRGVTFTAKIDVLESMGSEFYAYFVLESEKVSSRELEELAQDAGAADLPTPGGQPGRRPSGGGQPRAPGRGHGAVVQHRAPAPVRSRERAEPARRATVTPGGAPDAPPSQASSPSYAADARSGRRTSASLPDKVSRRHG